MLSNETMGVIALWVLWGNTTLVALAAARGAFRLLARARRLTARIATSDESRCVVGRVAVADGPNDTLAELEIEQVGRLGGGATPSIVFHDRAHRSRVLGGEIETERGQRLRLEATEHAEVWLEEEDVRAAALAPLASAWDEASVQAKKARGYTNLVHVSVRVGDRVFVSRPSNGGQDALVVAKIDPSAYATRRALAVLLVFIPAIFTVAGVATALALSPPVFDSVLSKLGGALGLADFLLVLPAGTAARDYMRLPFERFVRGSWPAPSEAPSANAVG